MISITRAYPSKSLYFSVWLLLSLSTTDAQTLKGFIEFPQDYPEKNNVVVWLEGDSADLKKSLPMNKEVDQKNVQFAPYITVATVGSKITFKNSDPNLHTVKAQGGPLSGMQKAMIPINGHQSAVLTSVGVSELLCDIHSQMRAFVVSVPNKFFAITGDNGGFEIKNPPHPPFTINLWHDVLPPKQIKVNNQAELKNLKIKLGQW